MDKTIKARVISLYQPYATLMVLGEKQNETRSWDTNYRGPVLIHATKSMPVWCMDLCHKEPFRSVLARHGYHSYSNLPKGAILGQVEIMDTMPSDVWLRKTAPHLFGLRNPRDVQEEHFGDYSAGRFAWRTANPQRFETPYPTKGSQGFWYVNPELIQLHAV